MLEWLNKTLNTEFYQVLGILACAAVLLWLYGCEPKVCSVLDPPQEVTRPELMAEVDMFNAKVESRLHNLDQQDQIRDALFSTGLTAAQTGTVNPYALLTTLGAIFGLGASVDNARKRAEIKKLKNSTASDAA